MPCRGPLGPCLQDSPVIPCGCARTACRAQSSACRTDSSMTAANSRPTACRTAGHASRVVGASPAPPCVTRRRTRSARSSSAFASRHRAHARRLRSRWHPGAPQTRWRSPARGCGRNHRRQTRHGRERSTRHRRLHHPNCQLRSRDQVRTDSGEQRRVNSRERRSAELRAPRPQERAVDALSSKQRFQVASLAARQAGVGLLHDAELVGSAKDSAGSLRHGLEGSAARAGLSALALRRGVSVGDSGWFRHDLRSILRPSVIRFRGGAVSHDVGT